MEVLWFLKQRTDFIRKHYETAVSPFLEIIRKIEDEEEPFEPPYSEDGEPAFMEEWTEARTSIEILGATCVSMLSESLRLYFSTWESILGKNCKIDHKTEFKQGFVNGYKTCFGIILNTDWKDCSADFDLIQQIALARNDAQHPKDITDLTLQHDPKVRERHVRPFFLSDVEKRLLDHEDYKDVQWSNLSLVVSSETLFEAIRQVETLTSWMEERLFEVKYGRR